MRTATINSYSLAWSPAGKLEGLGGVALLEDIGLVDMVLLEEEGLLSLIFPVTVDYSRLLP